MIETSRILALAMETGEVLRSPETSDSFSPALGMSLSVRDDEGGGTFCSQFPSLFHQQSGTTARKHSAQERGKRGDHSPA